MGNLNKRILDGFINMLLILNLIAAFLMTDQDISAQYGSALYLFSDISILFFVVEIAVRMWMCSRGGSMWYFFRSNGKWHHWNCFDFTVTLLAAVSLSSGLGVFVGARTLRMLRLLNTMRLFSRYQRLQSVSEAIVKSIPAIVGTGIYFSMLYSVYAIAGTNLYANIHPRYFGNVGRSFLTLFQIMTLDDWSEVMYVIMDEDPWAWLYFFSFILIASYVLLNLIVGVIVDSLQQVRRRRELEARSSSIEIEVEQMKQQLREFQMALEKWEGEKEMAKEKRQQQNGHPHNSRKTSKERKSGKSGKCKR
jgi:voltage-gated sodium channel